MRRAGLRRTDLSDDDHVEIGADALKRIGKWAAAGKGAGSKWKSPSVADTWLALDVTSAGSFVVVLWALRENRFRHLLK